MVFLYSSDADVLMKAMQEDPNIQVTLAESPNDHGKLHILFIIVFIRTSKFVLQIQF